MAPLNARPSTTARAIFVFALLTVLVGQLPVLSVYAQSGTPAGWNTYYLWPVGGGHPAKITGDYGINNSGFGAEASHSGLDIRTNQLTDAPIVAVAAGKVVVSENRGVSIQGDTVAIFHGYACDGTPVTTVYGHNKNLVVTVGQIVTAGQQLATAYGFMPPASSSVGFQPHLHFMFMATDSDFTYNPRNFRNPLSMPSLCYDWNRSPLDPNAQTTVPVAPTQTVQEDVVGREFWVVDMEISVSNAPSVSDGSWTVPDQPAQVENAPAAVRTVRHIPAIAWMSFVIAVVCWLLMSHRSNRRVAPAFGTAAVVCLVSGVLLIFTAPTERIAAAPNMMPTQVVAAPIVTQESVSVVIDNIAVPTFQSFDPTAAPTLQQSVYPTQPVQQPASPALSGSCPPQLASYFCEIPVGAIWGTKIVEWAHAAGITPNQSATVMLIESCGIPDAESGGGAIGLYQLLPSSFPEYSRAQLLDTETNGKLGNQYLSGQLSATGGNLLAAAAGYNGGPMARAWFLKQISRQEYINFLVNDKGWPVDTATDKADQVERYVQYFAIAEQADRGDRTMFDYLVGQKGRCNRAKTFYGMP